MGVIGAHQARFREIARLVRKRGQGGERILDLGCGSGGFLAELGGGFAPMMVGAEPFADPALQALQTVPGGRVLRAGWPKLPFADGTFDGIVCLEVLGHVADGDRPREFLEIARLLRPGGWFCLSVWICCRKNFVPESRVLALLHPGFDIEEIQYHHAKIHLWVGHFLGQIRNWFGYQERVVGGIVSGAIAPVACRTIKWRLMLTFAQHSWSRWLMVYWLRGVAWGGGGLDRLMDSRLLAQLLFGGARLLFPGSTRTVMTLFCRKRGD
ncbi:MAG: class I SAM-dependent methyltransferase [Magnetococcus sp. DMHC-6]